MVFNNRLLFL